MKLVFKKHSNEENEIITRIEPTLSVNAISNASEKFFSQLLYRADVDNCDCNEEIIEMTLNKILDDEVFIL